MTEEEAAREQERNTRGARIRWTFALAAARRKLRELHPVNRGLTDHEGATDYRACKGRRPGFWAVPLAGTSLRTCKARLGLDV